MHPHTLSTTTTHRIRLELIKAARAKPIGLPNSQVPLNFWFHHVFLRPTSFTEIRPARKQLRSTIAQKRTTRPTASAKF